ncbi:MAG: MFS transporter [Sphingobium sp.]|nr:MFS transporter [Sphingobium sp.]
MSGILTSTIAKRAPRSTGFILLFALANVGGVIGYLPLLTLLLPLKIEAIAGGAHIGVFTTTVIAGAVAASLANILFGWACDCTRDRAGGRRAWVAGGIVTTALSYCLIALAATPLAIVAAIVAFQLAVNMMLAPLFAIMADEIPDAQKGIASGWLALANPVASALSAFLVGAAYMGQEARLGIVCAAVAACIAPLLLTRPREIAAVTGATSTDTPPGRDLAIAWSARMAVQVAGNVLSLYLLYYFESLADGVASIDVAARVGQLLTLAYAIPLPVALIVGRLSDRLGRRKPFLLATAIVAAAGLVAMAVANHWLVSAAGFGCYAVGSAVFLALHSGFSMQLLPDPRHRGRDLGLLNLTNTLPGLIGPALAWMLATPHDFAALMLVLAAITLSGGIAILAIGSRR